MDIKNSLEANMEAIDLITFIRELDLTDPDDKETKQKLIDIYAESMFSQLSESDNECMEEFKALLGDKTVRESIVNFVTSKPPAVINEKGASQLPAINEESLRDIITETLTNEDDLMQNIQTKLDKIMRLIVVMEQNSTKSKPIKSRWSEKTPTAPPIIPPQPTRLLLKAFNEHPLNRWRRSAGTNTDCIIQTNSEPHEYGDIHYVPYYENLNHTRIPTYYRHQRYRQPTRNVSVQYERPCVTEKPDESGELYETCDYEKIHRNDGLHTRVPTPQESNMYYDNHQYYFDPQSAPPPLTRPTVQFKPPVLFKQPVSFTPPVSFRSPVSSRPPVSFRPPVSSRPTVLSKPRVMSRPVQSRHPDVSRSPALYGATYQCRPPHAHTSRPKTRRLDQWEPLPYCETLPQYESQSHPRHVRLLDSRQIHHCRPISQRKPESTPISQFRPMHRPKPLIQQELLYAKYPLAKNSPERKNQHCYSTQNVDFIYHEKPRPKYERTYSDEMPVYEIFLRNKQPGPHYNNITFISDDTASEVSSGEFQSCSDPTTSDTEEEIIIREEAIAVPKGALKSNVCQNKGRRRVTFLENSQQIFEY